MSESTGLPAASETAEDTIASQYQRLASEFADTVGEVNVHTWNDPSPCAGWSALDVLRHVIDSHAMVLGLVGDELWPGPPVGSDPLGAWISASDQLQARLDNPTAAVDPIEGEPGTTFEQAVDQLLPLDLIIHRWDIATAAGLDATISATDLADARRMAEALGDDLRGEGVFGPPLEPPAGADDQARLLAFLGRRAS